MHTGACVPGCAVCWLTSLIVTLALMGTQRYMHIRFQFECYMQYDLFYSCCLLFSVLLFLSFLVLWYCCIACSFSSFRVLLFLFDNVCQGFAHLLGLRPGVRHITIYGYIIWSYHHIRVWHMGIREQPTPMGISTSLARAEL